MRSAPVDAEERVASLVGGHRLSAALPWYRGALGAPMPPESTALCQVVEEEILGRPFAMAVDCHSGFGLADRLWFPMACSRTPIEHLPELHAFGEILDHSLLHHRYVLEPQSQQYLAHGDVWDHLYRRACAHGPAPFLLLTLEMGSFMAVGQEEPLATLQPRWPRIGRCRIGCIRRRGMTCRWMRRRGCCKS